MKELKSKADAVSEAVRPAREAIVEVDEKLQKLKKHLVEYSELEALIGADVKEVASKKDVYDLRLKTVEGIADNGRQLSMHKAFAEHEHVRMEVAAKLRMAIEGQNGKVDELFDTICKEGKMTKEDVRAYLEKHNSPVEAEKLEQVFLSGPEDSAKEGEEKKEGDGEDKGITREDFNRAIRLMYKVVKEIVLSDNLRIEQSKQIRRMDVGEVIEVTQGPTVDPSVGVYRVHGQALKDGIVGWVTVAGNQGVTFLLPGGNAWTCLKPVALTEELKESSTEVRKMREGEVLEVVEWARTSRSALGVTRIKGKLQNVSAKVGWATIADKDGNLFMEAT